MGSRIIAALALCAPLVVACGDDLTAGGRAGGTATTDDRTATAYSHTVDGLDVDTLARTHAGDGQFEFEWTLPQLGPLYNNTACINCHSGNGRGLDQIGPGVLTAEGVTASQGLVRVSLADGTPSAPGGAVPVPGFGTQLQDHALLGAQEVNVALTWTEMSGAFGDGDAFALRAPVLDIRTPDGQPFRTDAMRSFRQAPAAFGLGLLAAVPDDVILAAEDPSDADGNGIAGHANRVWDVATSTTVVGRFGAKANQSTLKQQITGAFANDIGVTNTLFPDATGATEIGDAAVDSVVAFLTTLAVPQPAPDTLDVRTGRRLFGELGCTGCHAEELVTGDSPVAALANQTIHPYTDLLLHDLGDGLADGRPDFLATGREWRTAPLWGLGLVQVVSPNAGFLHDGRARTIEEAVLWHGGEATAAREAFRTLARPDRVAVLAFLAAL